MQKENIGLRFQFKSQKPSATYMNIKERCNQSRRKHRDKVRSSVKSDSPLGGHGQPQQFEITLPLNSLDGQQYIINPKIIEGIEKHKITTLLKNENTESLTPQQTEYITTNNRRSIGAQKRSATPRSLSSKRDKSNYGPWNENGGVTQTQITERDR